MRSLLFFLALFPAALLADVGPKAEKLLPPPPAISIEAVYFATGTINNVEYRNIVVIVEDKDVYRLQWMDGARGIGLRNGNVLSVGCNPGGKGIGIAIFNIETDKKGKPRLVGKWCNGGPPGEETLEWLHEVD